MSGWTIGWSVAALALSGGAFASERLHSAALMVVGIVVAGLGCAAAARHAARVRARRWGRAVSGNVDAFGWGAAFLASCGYFAMLADRYPHDVSVWVGNLAVEPTTVAFVGAMALFGALGCGVTAATWVRRSAIQPLVVVLAAIAGAIAATPGLMIAVVISYVAVVRLVPPLGYAGVAAAIAGSGALIGFITGAACEAALLAGRRAVGDAHQ